ncbi:MAG TPA: Asp-tRNA(Asn)/Glu-tRNA(Gln) amidotransferase subunit GatB [Anaerolineales bacterium]|nr:Asp-tRNA(Asn)/Glu-tRNA(Gln) amidotransferase subunit GatB [Anaerolineales bacterium]HMR98374.1 Asp-tRNA(Asn)/Glu-tRNA(Gln) amidotransferase subunit GatB [Anaerolineales bacterium]HNQ94741.1 Asp-tRNA(Asn)/Glu-tRNA(Gln) amidotransferase subunit GatB [Anaerolineales bacterium]HNS62509.1 Asp-tRNA(Asn)/Glu-tRNA(Gln) amidotransferase subunit GatB [Anaerolineales bacterium]
MNYEPIIGLEVHAELLTRSKMFCGCEVVDSITAKPNRYICPVCTGQPGALPVLNRKAIELAVRVGLALGCEIHAESIFARKNYFYPDLPKGYQISQYDQPLATDGKLLIETEAGIKEIRIRRVHLEEDTGKLSHADAHSFIDYNRSGVPLLEIVTEPGLRSPDEAKAYASALRAILRYLDVNSGDMEKGVIRFEANVSVRKTGSDQLNPRTEIKNLNSFRALAQGIEYEIARQTEIYSRGGIVEQETLGFNEAAGKTYSQRGKEDAHDYRYFPEPDLPPLVLDADWIHSIRTQLPELPDAKTKRFISDFNLTPSDARFLTSDLSLAHYFERVAASSKSPAKTVHSWIAGEFMRNLNDSGASIGDVTLAPESFAQLIDMVTDKIIGGNAAKIVLTELLQNGGDPAQIVKEKGLAQVSDESFIQEAVTKVLNDNPSEVEKYLAGKETLLQWFVGQVARATKGKADPNVTRDALVKGLEERRK